MARVKSVSFPENKAYLIEFIDATGRNFSSVVVEAIDMWLQLEKDEHDFSAMKIQRIQTQIDSTNNQIKSLEITKMMLQGQITNEETKYDRLRDERAHKKEVMDTFEQEVLKEMKVVFDEYVGVLPLEDCRPYAERRIKERRR